MYTLDWGKCREGEEEGGEGGKSVSCLQPCGVCVCVHVVQVPSLPSLQLPYLIDGDINITQSNAVRAS